jgi:hypothetical protein
MTQAVPFILTIGTEAFKKFLTKPFTIDMLYSFGENSCQTLFEGWKGKDMSSWYKFINEDKYILEFYANYYIITKDNPTFKANTEAMKYRLPLPRDIDDFVNDMHRFNIEIFWSAWVCENFEPKDYLRKEDIEKYFSDLLNKMGKFNELL